MVCVSNDKSSRDADLATEDIQQRSSAGEDQTYGRGAMRDNAELPAWGPYVQFHPQTVAGVPAKGIAKLMAPKPAMCGHDVQVSFDSLVFLGTVFLFHEYQSYCEHFSTHMPEPMFQRHAFTMQRPLT